MHSLFTTKTCKNLNKNCSFSSSLSRRRPLRLLLLLFGRNSFQKERSSYSLEQIRLNSHCQRSSYAFFAVFRVGPSSTVAESLYPADDTQRACRFASFIFRIPPLNSRSEEFTIRNVSRHLSCDRLFF
jgi:hypothetical protein